MAHGSASKGSYLLRVRSQTDCFCGHMCVVSDVKFQENN